MYIYKKQFHSDAYFVALILMAASLPLSKFAMSVMQFTLLGLWLWAGFSFRKSFGFFSSKGAFNGLAAFLGYMLKLSVKNLREKFSAFFRNKAAMVLVSLFLLHVFGLIYTTDFAYAFKDLRIKLPLLAFPVILSTMEPLGRKRFHTVMIFHAMAAIIGTFFSTWILLEGEFTDIRKISIFISPIRFSLNICIAIFTLAYFVIRENRFNLALRFFFGLSAIWLIIFLFILESGIGFIVLLVTGALLLIYTIFVKKNPYMKTALIATIVLVPLALFFYFRDMVREYNTVEPVKLEQLDKYTAQGNKYVHDTVYFGVEDGKYVGLYLATGELKKAWNERSAFKFSGRDKNEQEIKYTLIRYLTSKGYRKDAAGVRKLTEEDVRAIERGIANVNYLENPSIRTRISKFMIGYHNYSYAHDPNGSSILQRIEYWKASLNLIQENFLLGVGTGDLADVFNDYYERTNSPLDQSNRWRAHNQYLTIFIAFGVFGFLWFLFTLFYPPLKTGKLLNYFYFVFFITILLSMLTEDTLETQAGATLFAFFNAFLLFSYKSSADQDKPAHA